jgi:hypothetical protein
MEASSLNLIGQHHRGNHNAERMGGHRLGSIGQATKGPTGTLQALQTLKFNKSGKHSFFARDTLPRSQPWQQHSAINNKSGDTIARIAAHSF